MRRLQHILLFIFSCFGFACSLCADELHVVLRSRCNPEASHYPLDGSSTLYNSETQSENIRDEMWMLVHMHALTYGKNRNAITRWLLPSISPQHYTASHYWMSRMLAHTYFVISICLQKWNIECEQANRMCATICATPFLPSLPFIHSFIQRAAASPLLLHESYWFTFISAGTCDFARQPHALWLDAEKCSAKRMLRAMLRSISNKDIVHYYYYLESYLGNGKLSLT